MKQKKKRSLNAIGKSQYNFDFQLEKTIYYYLCCKHTKKIKKLDNKLRFNSYKQWEKYIKDKYSGCDRETLIEFSRYLNQRIRDNESGNKYWELIIPVFMTSLITEFIKVFFSTETDWSKTPFLVRIFAIVLIIVVYIPIIRELISPIFENSTDGCMLQDYKEIIDNMIEK